MHLKLLNINIPIGDLENMFIEECESKNLSLYEVMLNYAYGMERIIQLTQEKRSKLGKSLGLP